MGNDKVNVTHAHCPLCDRIGVGNNAFRHRLRHLGVVICKLVEPCEAFEKLLVSATTIDRKLDMKASTEFVENLTLPEVFGGHGVLPAVENRLPLPVEVSHQDEDDTDKLPASQFHPSVQLHFGQFV